MVYKKTFDLIKTWSIISVSPVVSLEYTGYVHWSTDVFVTTRPPWQYEQTYRIAEKRELKGRRDLKIYIYLLAKFFPRISLNYSLLKTRFSFITFPTFHSLQIIGRVHYWLFWLKENLQLTNNMGLLLYWLSIWPRKQCDRFSLDNIPRNYQLRYSIR